MRLFKGGSEGFFAEHARGSSAARHTWAGSVKSCKKLMHARHANLANLVVSKFLKFRNFSRLYFRFRSVDFFIFSVTTKINWNQMKNNPRSYDRNCYNCVKKPEKNSGLQWGLNPWPCDTGATLYQLSYEATDVVSRSILGSYVPVKDMWMNDAYEINHMWTADMKSNEEWSIGCVYIPILKKIVSVVNK